MTVTAARRGGHRRLSESASSTPALDAEVLLAHVLGVERAQLLSRGDAVLSPEQERTYCAALEKRAGGTPVAYITGHKEFYGFDFFVTPAVLIPKPDTETVVQYAVVHVHTMTAAAVRAGMPFEDIAIIDVCTGSGCIGLSVARTLYSEAKIGTTQLPSVVLTLTDKSDAALTVAKKNAAQLISPPCLIPVYFACGDLLQAVPESARYDLILSNPPYVPTHETAQLLADGRGEPWLALDGGADGCAVIRRLVPQAYAHVKPGGAFICEVDTRTASNVAATCTKTGFRSVTIHTDLSGRERVVIGIR